jgi:serine/threonine protein kinase
MSVDRESASAAARPLSDPATLSGSSTGPRAPRAPAPPPLSPAGEEASLDKQMVKRALFPRRAGPARIGRYTVLAPIGRGGMGVVYACWDDELERKIAVKVLHGDVVRDPVIARTRLLREAQAMARLSHANIVAVHEVGQEAGRVHIAMEFVRGAPLDAWAAGRPWGEVLAAFVQAGRGLAAAHRAGLVHRDFKPQNVLVGDDGVVKVLDFGLARAADDEAGRGEAGEEMAEEPGSALARSLTRTGQVMGTPLYMSPEQHRGERAGPASDQFSFCVSLYQCLYGALPFASSSLGALLEDLRRGVPTPPPARSPVPARIFKALRRGLASAPGARYATMEELLAALVRDPAARVRRTAAVGLVAAVVGAASFSAA